mmetsp:Transcript_33970/g.101340  ORF Transcript_33970/g.101340 Transcript_33970/m.101340 type:complete len:243 (-) Transcript_33970:1219-1947(-)
MWSTVRESLPPERPTSTPSPSLIMPKSAMARPTRPRRLFGMLGFNANREKRGASAPCCGSSSSSSSGSSTQLSGASCGSASGWAPPALASFAVETSGVQTAHTSSTECAALVPCPSMARKTPPSLSASWGRPGCEDRRVKATSAGRANHRRCANAGSSPGHFEEDSATCALLYASRRAASAAARRASLPWGARAAAPAARPRELSSCAMGPAGAAEGALSRGAALARKLESHTRRRSGASKR